MGTDKQYDGYQPYDYLEAGEDFRTFPLSVKTAGFPPREVELDADEEARVDELTAALLCSTLLISESRFDGVFERFSSEFAVEFSSELERSALLNAQKPAG